MHKKAYLLLILIFMMASAHLAADSRSNVPVAYLKERVYTFTPVVEGTTVTHEFVLQNRGQEPLDILEINSG